MGQLYKLIPKHRPRGQKARLYGDLPKPEVQGDAEEGFQMAIAGGESGLIAPGAEGYVQAPPRLVYITSLGKVSANFRLAINPSF